MRSRLSDQDIAVAAIRAVDAVQRADLAQDVERPEDRRPPDLAVTTFDIGEELFGCERPLEALNGFDDDLPGPGHAVSLGLERIENEVTIYLRLHNDIVLLPSPRVYHVNLGDLLAQSKPRPVRLPRTTGRFAAEGEP